jgi:hypothetical protein
MNHQDLFQQLARRLTGRARRLVVCCLLVALPVYGASGTLVQLLGSDHVHRVTEAAARTTDALAGWVDMRRGATMAKAAGHVHTHSLFQRHHHDRADASVVSVDGGSLGGAAADDAGAPDALVHVLALTDAVVVHEAGNLRFPWPSAAPAAALPWLAEGPLRPPKS